MTDEERQRQMDFIVNTLANITVTQEKSELERKADAVRISRLEEAFVSIKRLSESMYERLDEHEQLIKTLAQMAQKSDERLDRHDTRIEGVEEAIVILTKLLNRGSNGTS